MKKICLLLLISFQSLSATAQDFLPSYYEVLKHFFTKYNTEEKNEDYTSFAKKKNGWYVQQINKIKKDEFINEKLFWSLSEGKYVDVSGKYKIVSDTIDFENKIKPYLNLDWYKYDRIRYFGYNGWQYDMIHDYGNSNNLSDTLLDGLGRAYDNNALNYLWYQLGGNFQGKDSMQTQLKRLELPSAARIEKVKENINNAISQIEKLAAKNPNYQTPVGNANLKLFNEYMLGYNQMMMCNNEKDAQWYISKTKLDERYINQAKNYLNSCEKNAILFTYGDNDTYQLWYVQEKLNYRRDIAVINTSLLGATAYVMMLMRKNIVDFFIPASYLQDETSDVAYFKESKEKAQAVESLNIRDFLTLIYSKKSPISYINPEGTEALLPGYPSKKIYIPTPAIENKTLTIQLKEYVYLNELLTLDIIECNRFKRPVYFTASYDTYFDSYLIPVGIVYKINLSKEANTSQSMLEIKDLEDFLDKKHIPVLSNGKDIISLDGDISFFYAYYQILNNYLENKDIPVLKKWLRKLEASCPEINSAQINVAKNLAYYYIEAGEAKKGIAIIDQFAQWLYDNYTVPDSLNGYYSKETYIDELSKTKEYLTSKNLTSVLIDNLLKE